MGLEQNNEQHYREVPDKYVDPAAYYEMNTKDYIVRPNASKASGPIIVLLPRVAEAKGRFYSIICRNADPVNTVTIADRGDSECWANDIVMNGKCDRLFLYSDGLAWMPTFTGGFPQASTTYPPGTSEAPTTAAITEAPTTL